VAAVRWNVRSFRRCGYRWRFAAYAVGQARRAARPVRRRYL